MKSFIITALATAFLCGSAFAVPTFLGSAQLSPDNPANEEAYLESLLGGGIDVDFWKKDDNLSGDSWTVSELCPGGVTTYVALKWGGQGGGTQFFYAIDADEPLPVVFTKPVGLGGLSHVTYWCGVPDFGSSIAMLGGAFAALGAIRRKIS